MRHSGDDGMTLIELLISVTLVTVVMGALTTAMLLVYDTTDASRNQISDTSGAQLVTSWLVSDAQSAGTISPSPGCGGSPLLELQWTDAKTANGVVDVQYVEQAGAAGTQLARVAYSVSSAGVCTQTNSDVLVRGVNPSSSATYAYCLPTKVPECSGTPTEVGLNVTATIQTNTGNYAPYTFQSIGYRRTQ